MMDEIEYVHLFNMIKKHEGFRSKPYKCTAGKLTIGYGFNLEAGITEQEAAVLLKFRLMNIEDDICEAFEEWYPDLDGVRQAVVTDMVFNLGIEGFKKFKNTIHFIKNGKYDKASVEMLDSRWANQVGARAVTLSMMMETGRWETEFREVWAT